MTQPLSYDKLTTYFYKWLSKAQKEGKIDKSVAEGESEAMTRVLKQHFRIEEQAMETLEKTGDISAAMEGNLLKLTEDPSFPSVFKTAVMAGIDYILDSRAGLREDFEKYVEMKERLGGQDKSEGKGR